MNYAQIGDWQIPSRIAGGLARYTLGNIQTGSGLRAILEGDLFETVARCDPEVIASLGEIVRVIVNYTPSACFGSTAIVDSWILAEDGWTVVHVTSRYRRIWEAHTND